MDRYARADRGGATGRDRSPAQGMHRGVQQVWGCRATPSPFSVAVGVHPASVIPSGVNPNPNAGERSGRVVPRPPGSPNPVSGARGCQWVGAPTPPPTDSSIGMWPQLGPLGPVEGAWTRPTMEKSGWVALRSDMLAEVGKCASWEFAPVDEGSS